MNFNMSRMTVPLHELLNMLTTAEGSIKKTKGSAFFIHEASTSKSKPKGKEKWKGQKSNMKATGGIRKGKPGNDKGKGCFYCGKYGHWKRNCREFLASIKDKPSEGMSNLLFIETNLSINSVFLGY